MTDAPRTAPRLRLVKVAVQPTFVLDDGDTLTEMPGQAVEIPAKQWAGWAASAFTPETLADLLTQYDAATTTRPAPADDPR